jgi:hypothetical protein
MSPCAHAGETSMSPIRTLPDRATHLSHAPIEPSDDDLLTTEGGASRAAVTEDTDDAI